MLLSGTVFTEMYKSNLAVQDACSHGGLASDKRYKLLKTRYIYTEVNLTAIAITSGITTFLRRLLPLKISSPLGIQLIISKS